METTEYFALFRDSEDPQVLRQQVRMLRRALIGLAQDVTVLRRQLTESGALDPSRYRRLRIERMIDDHSSAGAVPWMSYSHYPYLLDDEQYLRTQLGASEAEVEEFRKQVEFKQQLT